MSYHEILGLDREPFGNSPDPDFFHNSPRHAECLRRLEIAVRLKRGLCVVMGEVGTGKSTVCRRLLRTLNYDPAISAHLLLDPCFEDPRDFLAAVAVSFGILVDGEDSAARIREAIQEFLLAAAASGDTTVVLCVDEGQKITGPCLEILRELLNFEVNTHKLLQIVVFAQNEFAGALRSRKNLADRINTRVQLKPLSFSETKRLIRTRLRLAAGESWKDRDPALFTRAALFAIHRACGGYPRRIMRLCHATLLETVGREKAKAGLAEVRAARRTAGEGGLSWRAAAVAALPVAAVLAMLAGPGRERAVEMLDTGLLRMGEAVSSVPDSIPGYYDAARQWIASADFLQRKPLAESGEVKPEAAPVAAPAAAPAAASAIAPVAAPVVASATPLAPAKSAAAAPVAAPVATPVAAASPAASPVVAPAATPVATPSAPSAEVPAAPSVTPLTATAHVAASPVVAPTPSVAPVAVAAQANPVTPPSVSPEALRVVPADLPVAALRTIGVEPVIIEVATAPAAPVAVAPAPVPAQAELQATPPTPAVQAAAPAQAPAAVVAAPPRVLGEMVMRSGWTLSKVAARLYGSGGRRVMNDVAAANPGIADLDLVRPGAKVAFPARQTEPLPMGASVVLFDRKTDLDAAFAALSALRDSVPQAVLYAHYSPRSGLVFDVVLDRYHGDMASAQKALDALPHGVAVKAQVVEYLDDVTVAYSVLEPAGAGASGTVRTVAQNAALPQ